MRLHRPPDGYLVCTSELARWKRRARVCHLADRFCRVPVPCPCTVSPDYEVHTVRSLKDLGPEERDAAALGVEDAGQVAYMLLRTYMSPRTWFLLPQRQVIKRARRESPALRIWRSLIWERAFIASVCMYCLPGSIVSSHHTAHRISFPGLQLTTRNRALAQRSTAQHTGPNQTLQRAGQGQLSCAFGITTSEKKKRTGL